MTYLPLKRLGAEMAFSSKLYLFHYLLLLMLSLPFRYELSLCADKIVPGQPLSGNRTITSSNSNFVLGFFKPDTSSKYYIGMQYKYVPHKRMVWVANRNIPISDPYSSELKIADDGNLVLTDKYNVQIWSTNLTFIAVNSTEAVLLDNGNLVLVKRPSSLVKGRPASPAFVWQSFDHPTDTWLPGGKIGFNKLTNRSQTLTSWRSGEDPGEGQLSLAIDLTGGVARLVFLNGSEVYFSSIWTKYGFLIVGYSLKYWTNGFEYISNENESYFSYSPIFQGYSVQLDVSGRIKIYINSSLVCLTTYCGAYGICDESLLPLCKCVTGFKPNHLEDWTSADFSGGCIRRTFAQCKDMKQDTFQRTNMIDFSSGTESIAYGSFGECRRECLNDCNCTAYANFNSRCVLWRGNLTFTPQASSGSNLTNVYYRLPKLDPENAKAIPRRIIVGIALGSTALLSFLLLLFWRCGRNLLITTVKPVDEYITAFSFRYLKIATKNFSEKLGEGGCGSVFKGKFPDSTCIAVKRLKFVNKGEKEFRNEVRTIGVIQHVNLIRLRGFCAEKTQRLLVYDHMPKRSLDLYLFGKNSQILNWETRYKIAIGAAKGLAYLHESCHDCIIHCDVKPANILLDEEFNAKVSDFGIAKLLDRDFSRVLTTMKGTRGYMALEWLSGEAITPKVDVYSYGMTLFEIISGRRNLEITADDVADYFPTRAVNIINTGEEVVNLLDYKLEDNVNKEELIRALRVASWCIQDAAEDRPSMKVIVQILDGGLEVDVPPVPRLLEILE